jgi:uncharacterized membrane protein YdjX (TVP38/TMEM64 family)
MSQRNPETDWWAIGGSVALFLGATWLTNEYHDQIALILSGQGLLAIMAYLVIVVAQVVVAPVNTAPLVPIAAAAWGPLGAVVLTLLGWTIGSSAVFALVRRFGFSLVSRALSARRIEQLQRIKPTLSTVIALRLLVPIDLISYALAFVPGLTFRNFTIGTTIGYIPYAFLYAYLGDAPLGWQLIIIGVTIAVIVVGSPRWFDRLTR